MFHLALANFEQNIPETCRKHRRLRLVRRITHVNYYFPTHMLIWERKIFQWVSAFFFQSKFANCTKCGEIARNSRNLIGRDRRCATAAREAIGPGSNLSLDTFLHLVVCLCTRPGLKGRRFESQQEHCFLY